jgi:hypothetical protein
MRPPFDDLRWDDLVAQTILSPEFAEAWEVLNGSGIGSPEASAHVAQLIRDSDWHLSRLEVQHAAIMEAAAKASWDLELSDSEFDQKVAAALPHHGNQLHDHGRHAGCGHHRPAGPPR